MTKEGKSIMKQIAKTGSVIINPGSMSSKTANFIAEKSNNLKIHYMDNGNITVFQDVLK
jgi:stalled ribosome rescue protein Dom34